MNGNLYTAASGLAVEARRLEVISNNLANLSTAGFRARRVFSEMMRLPATNATPARARMIRPVALAGSYALPGPGPRQPTGRALDVALAPGEWLAVDSPAGRRYTRAGSLDVSPEGELVNAQGYAFLGDDGRPVGGLSPAARVTGDGRVIDGGEERGRLLVLSDPLGVLTPTGGSLHRADGRTVGLEAVAEPRLEPGWLEGSNTNVLEELVRLVEAQRAFEGYQKLISMTMNEVNRRAVTEIAG